MSKKLEEIKKRSVRDPQKYVRNETLLMYQKITIDISARNGIDKKKNDLLKSSRIFVAAHNDLLLF